MRAGRVRNKAAALGRLILGLLTVLMGLGLTVPSAEAADPAQVGWTGVGQSPDQVHLAGTVVNAGQALYQAGVAVWVDPTALATPAELNAALATSPLAGDGVALTSGDTTYVSLSSGRATFAAGATTDFDFSPTWADLGLEADGVYLVGVELRGATSRYGTVTTLARARTLVTLATTTATKAVTVVALTSTPSWLYGDVFADDHLAGELTGRLTSLIGLAEQAPNAWVIDPALYQAVTTMAAGYQVLVNGRLVDGAGQSAAQAWLTRADQLDQRRGYRLPWADPDTVAARAGGDDRLADQLVGIVLPEPLAKLPLLVRAANGLGDQAWLADLAGLAPDVVLAGAATSGWLNPGELIATAPVAFPGGPEADNSADQVEQRRLADDYVNGTTVRWIDNQADAALAAQPEPAFCQPVGLSAVDPGQVFDPADLLGPAAAGLTGANAANLTGLAQAAQTYAWLIDDSGNPSDPIAPQQVAAWSQAWPDDTAAGAYAQAVADWLNSQIDQVSVRLAGPVTLTSRTTTFPVDVTNHLDRPVYVQVVATSSSPQTMTFTPTATIMVGPGDTLPATLSPRVDRDGTVTVSVGLLTADGRPFGPVQSIEVTANQSAWLGWAVIVVAGALFVAGTFLRVRTARRKAGPGAGQGAGEAADQTADQTADQAAGQAQADDDIASATATGPSAPLPSVGQLAAIQPEPADLAPAELAPAELAPAEPAPAELGPAESAAPGHRSLLGSTLLMASGTLVSRILGAVKMLLLTYLIGAASRQSEIYSVATMIPTSMYTLIAGGVLNAVLVPQIVRAIKNDPDNGDGYTNRVMTAFLLVLVAATVALVFGARLVAWLYSDARWHTAALVPQFESMVLLTALVMPQVFFMGLYTIVGQILVAHGSFGPMMWAPVANNVVQIGLLGLYSGLWGFHTDWSAPFSTNQALLLGLGSVVGVAVQAIILMPVMHRAGFHYRPRFDLRGTGLGHTLRLAGWTLGYVCLSQVVVWYVTRLTSSATANGHGAGNAAYNYAYFIWMVPHSLLTVSLGTALFPSLSRRAADRDWLGFRTEFVSGLRILTTAIVPVSFLLVGLGIPIATLAFRGNTGGVYIGQVLMILGAGLIPYMLQYVTQNGLYATEDTRSPFFVQAAALAVTCALAALLIVGLQVDPNWVAQASAVARSLSYFVAGVGALWVLQRKVPALRKSGLAAHIARLCLAAIPGTVLAWLICFEQKRLADSFLVDLIGLVAAAGVAVGVYLGIAKLMHLRELDDLVAMVRRRLGRGKAREQA